MADLEGFERMIAELEAIKVKVVAATPDALAQAGSLLEAQVQTELARTSHPPGTPTPSPPGSPPSLVSGRLRRSVQVEGPSQVGAGRWSLKVGADTPYARIQEYGGTAGNGAQLPPRPYMAPALATSLPAMQLLFVQAWADALH